MLQTQVIQEYIEAVEGIQQRTMAMGHLTLRQNLLFNTVPHTKSLALQW